MTWNDGQGSVPVMTDTMIDRGNTKVTKKRVNK